MSLIATELAPKGEVRQPLQGEGHAASVGVISPLMGNDLRDLRTARDWTHDHAANEMGISRSQFIKLERGERGLTERTIALAAKAFGVSRARVMGEAEVSPAEADAAPSPPSNASRPEEAGQVDIARFKGPRNVPVLGTGVGGDEGDFRFNGQRIDHAPRPPGIADRLDVYAIYVVGDSMAPAYEDGTLIYVDPHRRPAPRDYVVVEKHGSSEDEPGDAFVKRLVRRSAAKVVVEQFNPKDEITFAEADVKRVHRVIPWPELIGI